MTSGPHAAAHPTPADVAFARFRETGDAEAAGTLFDETADELFRMALSLTPDASAAEDALQETYLAALRQAGEFDTGRPVRPWLFGILRRQVGRARRQAARSPDPRRLETRAAPTDPVDDLVSNEDRERVQQAIESLPEPYRSVALMRWCYGMKPAEIAHVRDQAPGTVRSLLHRAVDRLRPLLGALPALLFADAVALGQVRGRVLEEALRLGPPTSSPVTPVATLTGGLLMSTTPKLVSLVVVALLALIAVGVGVSFLGDPTDGAASETSTADLQDEAANDETSTEDVRVRRPERASAPDESVEPAVAVAVDLTRVDRTTDLHGRVLDADGNAVRGARVVAFYRPWRRANLFHPDDVTRTGPETTTDGEGAFALRLAPGDIVDLDVSATGHADGGESRCQAGERIEITLEAARLVALELDVHVVDSSGRAITGALVRATCAVCGESVETHSDADGQARVALTADRRRLELSAQARGFALARVRGIDPDVNSTTMELSPATGLSGQVTDARTGEPVAGASVGLGHRQRDAVTTDDDGRYELAHFGGAAYAQLVVSAPGYGTETRTIGDRTRLDLALAPGRAITGRVVDSQGRAVPGARIAALGERSVLEGDMLSLAHANSGSDGHFALADLRRDTVHTIVLLADGHGRTIRIADAGAGTLDLGDVVLADGHAISGRVVNADGEPLARVRMRLVGPLLAGARPRSLGAAARTTLGREEERFTDDLGRFHFPEQSPGEYRLRALPEGAPATDLDVTVGAQDVVGLEIALTADRTVEIQVRGPEGTAMEGVWCLTRSGTVPAVRTDADGRARIQVPAGETPELWLQDPRADEHAWLEPEPIVLRPDLRSVELEFRSGIALTGHVVDGDGSPLPGLEVSVRRGGVELTTVSAERDGSFRHVLPDATPLDLVLTGRAVRWEGRMGSVIGVPYQGRVNGIVPGGEPVEIVAESLPFDGSLGVRVLSPDGAPVSGVTVRLVQPSVEGRQPVVTDAEGRAQLEGLPQGEVMVYAHFAGKRPPDDWIDPERLTVTSDGSTHEMRFRQGHPVTGVVREGDGSSSAQTIVRVLRGESYVGAVVTDAEGRFRALVPDDGGAGFTLVATVNDERGIVNARAEDVRPGQDVVLVLKP